MSSQPHKDQNMKSRLIPKNVFVDHQMNQDVDLIELKLPSVLRIQGEAFEPSTYQVEEPIVYTNDKGVLIEKVCAIEDIIRWRYVKEAEQNGNGQDISVPKLDKKLEIDQSDHRKIESNAKIVQWSDGTYSLAIGDEFFEINMENLTNRQCYTQFQKFFWYKGSVTKKMIVKPPPKSQKNQKRFIQRINEAQQKIQQANITVAANDAAYEKLKNQKGVSTIYQVENGDDVSRQGNGQGAQQNSQRLGVKRTMEQARADLEGDYGENNGAGDDSYQAHGSNASKRLRTGVQTDMLLGRGINDQQNDMNQQSLLSNQNQAPLQEDDDDEEEIYQSRTQIENKALPPKSDDEDDDSDSSDSSEEGPV